jgi:probable HAF family extracellular repeat protein
MIGTRRVLALLALAGAGCGDLNGTESDDVALAEGALQIAPNLQTSGAVVQTAPTTTTDQSLVATSVPTRYYLIDVGPAETGPTPRLNRNGAAIWNANGHAFVYQNCQSRDLGSLAGGPTFARGINSAGEIVGKSKVGEDFHAFSWSNGTMRDLGGTRGFAFWQEAIASNYLGDVVGNEGVSTVVQSGVRFQSGVTVPLATFNGLAPTRVVDMNDSAFVVATQEGPFGTRALLSTNGGHLWRQVLGVPGLDAITTPFAENAYGHVVGTAGNGFVRAFVSRDPDQPATDLGTLGGSLAMAEGINSQGWVVGWAEATDGGGPRAFLHDRTTMIDLNTRLTSAPGWLLLEANAINDAGQIVAWAGSPSFQNRIVFLEPAKTRMAIPRCAVGSLVISAGSLVVKG